MLVLLFCKLSEQYSQTNFPIIKPFRVKKKKKKNEWQIFRPKVGIQETELTNVKI